MSDATKQPTMGAKTAMALEEAKAIRAKQYAYKDRRIVSMLKEGVTKQEVIETLHVSGKYITKVLKREGVTT